jgi:hypothetical protein
LINDVIVALQFEKSAAAIEPFASAGLVDQTWTIRVASG